ncbi:sulfotransferase family protein [Rhodovulum sp. 12E13]|uniref:tetratricopeptide repeat-containing sulfotransferase family protein n=1 Tax=Rhodovulum sp. 12E13 TaxID=2203891 RepID=UPI000E18B01F|nr:sulfotransferase [Rhodovulum sp. 12E13]RDC71338.1 sulfotransferase family protein [Rhodovulum sp. 12E13]
MAAQNGTARPAPRKSDIETAYRKARALHEAGRLREAAQGYAAVARAAPGLAEPHFQLGRIALARGDADAALAALDQARGLKPDEPAILAASAEALGAAGRTREALAAWDDLIRRMPREVKPRADKALLLQRMGDFEAAEEEFRRALKRAPRDGELYRMLVTTRRVRKGEPLLRQMLDAHADPAVTGRSRMQLQFALAKAMADTGQHDRVFRYLDPANAAMRAAQPYDIARRRAEVDGLIAAFRGGDFTPLAEAPEGPRPIFVTGLPRSGTTLVEQILASHPRVTGGGEMRFVLEEAYRLMGDPGRGFTRLADLADEAVAGFARAYLDLLARAVPDAATVTDKSIQTHLVIGLVARALPEARIVVVRRDPRDLGLSIYRNVFAPGTHLYAYDQADIAAYVATFERMMAFWRETLPGRFTELRYEDLVADPEPQTRALVAAAGLDWDAACLSFHQTERQVATLSIQQVRQPIHGGAAGGWRRHEADLAPMIAALEREGVELP